MSDSQVKARNAVAARLEPASGVSIRAVSKSFGETNVIDNVSLEISAGEFVVFLGPSGCGKSTILRMIAGLETIDSGEIHIGAERVDLLPPGKRDVAMVFQNYALYPHMTVKDNLVFGLKNAGVARNEIESRVNAVATSLEIDQYLARKPGQLSGGQRQRVAIARAIVKEPRIFLFDEPLSNLDAALRTRTRIELAQLHRRLGATMIFVTHDQVEAMTLADKIVLLNNKKIEQIGAPMEIYRRPASIFAASFVGAPKINILDAEISRDESGYAVAKLSSNHKISTLIPARALPTESRMTIGVRPEHVSFTEDASEGAICDVQVVEKLGDRAFLYGALPEAGSIVAEADGRTAIKAGDRISLKIDGSAAHLFDKEGRAYHRERQQ